jgi:hypothetical protein
LLSIELGYWRKLFWRRWRSRWQRRRSGWSSEKRKYKASQLLQVRQQEIWSCRH